MLTFLQSGQMALLSHGLYNLTVSLAIPRSLSLGNPHCVHHYSLRYLHMALMG